MITNEEFTKFVNFMTPGVWVLVLGRAWPYKLYSENALFLEESSSLHSGIHQTN